MCVCALRRQRALKPGQSPYRALLETLELTNTKLTLQLINDNNKVCYTRTLIGRCNMLLHVHTCINRCA